MGVVLNLLELGFLDLLKRPVLVGHSGVLARQIEIQEIHISTTSISYVVLALLIRTQTDAELTYHTTT